MEKTAKIFIAGHRGLVGSAIRRGLEEHGYTNLLLRTRAELDLTDKAAVRTFFEQERPEYVFLAAAKVGGIVANDTYPADFIRENLEIQTNVIDAAYRSGVKRLLFLGSSCIYPKLCPQPIKEEYLLTGPLEPTNRAYALAKIAGIEMCWAYNRQYGTQFLAAMPTNLYGPNDNFDLKNSHVLPALIRKAAEAKAAGEANITVWGTGTPRRELLYSDDLAEACLYLMSLPDAEFGKLLTTGEPPLINIGTGEDLTIRELAELVCKVVGFAGELIFDTTRPDGTPRKLMDVSRIHALGWQAKTPLEDGIRRVYESVKDLFLAPA
ncbi:GDP-L-fucose synthase family protein [Silvibacterium dinghuense]|uniref:GDP-L-fucose synthase n=1 Tax=Silvibacterium dinghuense TaxID=1560006 RepID=A0A4Q1SBB4_9BACT|nr:GDP-L-fucose synthase [Silvibacterium dinghuense]RXS94421.1 GDP-L-fucose synthase [Silvibacterium dinghuense]GGH16226.1 GDP-L-fucose synthase [Silvibacterium dinghuense]